MSNAKTDSGEPASQTQITENLSVLLEAVYHFAGAPEEPGGLFELSDILTQFDLTDGHVPGEIAAHFARAVSIAEKIGDGPNAATPPALPANCVELQSDGKVTRIGTEVAAWAGAYCHALEVAKPLQFAHQNVQQQLSDALDGHRAGEAATSIIRLVDETGGAGLFGILRAAPAGLHFSFVAPPKPDAMDEAMAKRLGLTPAEGRLLGEVQAGHGLKAAAENLGIAHNTARNQLKSVFAKLGVKRQAELVRHLTFLNLLASQEQDTVASAVGPNNEPALAGALTAFQQATKVDLPDGRSLGYYIIGPAIGQPVVVINSPTQTFLPHDDFLKVLARLNICLVVLQRPGFGVASAKPGMTFESLAQDMPYLREALQNRFMCSRFPILGLASGAPFALAIAAGFGEGASALGLASPRLNVDASNRNRPLGDAVLFLHAMKAGWALDFAFSILKTRLSDETIGRVVDRVFAASPKDAELLNTRPALRQSIIAAAREGFNASAATLANETRLLRDGYNVDWETFPAPIIVWQGGEDQINPLGRDRASFGNMPLNELRLFPDSGHLLLEQHLDVMLTELLALANGPAEK